MTYEEHHEYGTGGARLKDWAQRAGLTQARLASLCGGTESFIVKLFKRQARPEARRMLIIQALTSNKINPCDWFPSGFTDSYVERYRAYSKAWELEQQELSDNPDLPPRYRTGGKYG